MFRIRYIFIFLATGIWYLVPWMSIAGNVENRPGTAIVVVENIVFEATPVTDVHGNIIGVTIPLKRAGRLFCIEGVVDNVTGNFILDTGASGLVLNKTYFRNSIEVEGEEGSGVTGTTGAVTRMYVKKLQASELVFNGISADVAPLGHLENRRGIKIIGLLGMSLLRDYEMVIDLRNSELQLYRLDKQGNRPGSTWPVTRFDITQKIELFRNIMFVKASVGGKVLDFCLDTGAESNIIRIDAPKQVTSTVKITRRSTLSGAGTSRIEVLYGSMSDFKLGSHALHPMETILCSMSALASKYNYPVDGMLGYDFFCKGKIYINLVRKEMGICLWKEAAP